MRSYMKLIEHWGSGIPRIINKATLADLRAPTFEGGEMDLRICIYRGVGLSRCRVGFRVGLFRNEILF